jgi:hypothetical protein
MSEIPKFTVCIALDLKTIEQLRVSIWTWYINSPILWQQPWLITYDHGQISETTIRDIFTMEDDVSDNHMRAPNGGVKLRAHYDNEAYANQREKMLTTFVFAPEAVETDWWLKVDTDSVAGKDCGKWVDGSWFEPDDDGRYNAWVSSSWGYTKPGDQMNDLDNWGDKAGIFGSQFPRLNIPFEPGSRRCRHRRMASWISFYNTAISKQIAGILRTHYDGEPRIPAPSQDGFVWYFCERSKDRTQTVRFKKRGWSNHSKLENLRIAAEEALK